MSEYQVQLSKSDWGDVLFGTVQLWRVYRVLCPTSDFSSLGITPTWLISLCSFTVFGFVDLAVCSAGSSTEHCTCFSVCSWCRPMFFPVNRWHHRHHALSVTALYRFWVEQSLHHHHHHHICLFVMCENARHNKAKKSKINSRVQHII